MHIKDHSAAMKFFRTYDTAASKGKWKEFVDEMEFDSMLQQPRTMAQEPRMGLDDGGRIIGKPGGIVEPGVMYYGKKVPHGSSKDKTALSANAIKKIKNKIKLPVGVKWDFYDPNPNSKTYNPNGQTYGIRKTKYPKLWERGRNIGKEGRAETKLKKATETYKKIKADPDLSAEKQLYDRELYMGKREQVLEDLNFKYATDKKFREAKLEYEKIQRIENPTKYKQKLSDWYAKHGKFPPGNNYKENVWRDMFRSSQKSGQKRFLLVDESGKLLTPDDFPKVDGKVRWDVGGAYKNAKFYDTKTKQFVKFDDTIKGKGMGFEKYLDQKSVGGKGAFNNAVDGYKNADAYKNLTFKNAKGENIRLGTLMHSKLKTKTDFVKSGINLQHPDLNNAFWKNEVSTATSNNLLRNYEKNLNRDLKAYKNNPIKKAEALAKFKTNIEKLPGGITKVIEGTTYGIKPTAKSVISEVGKEFGATKYKSFSEKIKPKGSGVQLSSVGGVFDDALKSKALKKVGSGARKIGLGYELGFVGLDFMNNLDNGMDPDTAFQTALSNATLGMYEGGDRAQWEDFETAGKELGHNPENLSEIKSIMDLEKMLTGEKQTLNEMIAYNAQEGTGAGLQGVFSQEEIEWRKQVVDRLEKEFENKQNTFWSKDNAQDLVENYQDTVGYVARKEYNKNFETGLLDEGRKDRVHPEMGSIGSPLWEVITDWKDYAPQSFLPQNFLQNEITKAIPNTLRKLPVIGKYFEPTSEQAKLFDMSKEEKEQRAKDLNIQEQYYHPVTGNTMTYGQMEPYYEKFYSGGGIASLMKK